MYLKSQKPQHQQLVHVLGSLGLASVTTRKTDPETPQRHHMDLDGILENFRCTEHDFGDHADLSSSMTVD